MRKKAKSSYLEYFAKIWHLYVFSGAESEYDIICCVKKISKVVFLLKIRFFVNISQEGKAGEFFR